MKNNFILSHLEEDLYASMGERVIKLGEIWFETTEDDRGKHVKQYKRDKMGLGM